MEKKITTDEKTGDGWKTAITTTTVTFSPFELLSLAREQGLLLPPDHPCEETYDVSICSFNTLEVAQILREMDDGDTKVNEARIPQLVLVQYALSQGAFKDPPAIYGLAYTLSVVDQRAAVDQVVTHTVWS